MKNIDTTYLAIIQRNARYTADWGGAFLAFLPIVPIIATIISITVFVISWPTSALSGWFTSSPLHPLLPFFTGTLLALLLWFLLALLYYRFTAVDQANEESYDALRQHLSDLDASLDTTDPEAKIAQRETLDLLLCARIRPAKTAQKANGSMSQSQQATILAEQISDQALRVSPAGQTPADNGDASSSREAVFSYRSAICFGLMQKSLSWVTGSGYLKLWDLMDKAEETLIAFAPTEKVISAAVYDEMRLNDSHIENNEEWRKKLRTAALVVDADAYRYLTPLLTSVGPTPGGSSLPPTIPQGGNNTAPAVSQAKTVDQQTLQQARAVLQLVRQIINDFDAKNWKKLLQARSQLLSTMTLVGLVTYGLVELIIATHVNPVHLFLLTIFGFVGALSGLLGRLSDESQSNTAIDDYNLATARMLATPLLSALAAVIGIIIVSKTTILENPYSIASVLTNFILAATFGLTPNLLLDQLRKKADEYKGNLKSTQPTSGK